MASVLVSLWKFAKRLNSTAAPADSNTPVTLSGTLRDETSILAPVIGFDFGTSGNDVIAEFGNRMPNYALVNAPFYRFYFIKDWEYADGLWWASMSVDVLGSFKSEIGNHSAYISRCASSNGYDTGIVDSMWPVSGGVEIDSASITSPWIPDGSTQTEERYIIGFVAPLDLTTRTQGSVNYYAGGNGTMQQLMNALMGNADYLGTVEELGISNQLAKTLFNPSQYIASCRWVPYSIPGTVSSSVKIGWWEYNIGVIKFPTGGTWTKTFTIRVPKHPLAASRPYMKKAPFSRYFLYVPPWGEFELDTGILYDMDNLNLRIVSDIVTGDSSLELLYYHSDGSYTIAFSRQGNVGFDIPMSQIVTEGKDWKSTGAKILGSAAANAVAGWFDKNGDPNIAGIFSGIADGVQGYNASVSTSGGSPDGMTQYNRNAYLRLEYQTQTEINYINFGRPSCKYLPISTVPGYVKCGNPGFSCEGTEEENRLINNYLSGGFYYE